MTAPPPDIAATPAWLPFDIDPDTGQVILLAMTEADYRAASFLDHRVLKPGYNAIGTEWAELTAAIPAGARRDAHYIFHIGNVGSTLISRLLAELPDVFAPREPLLLRAFAAAPPEAGRFDTLVALLSRTFRPEQRAIVKATSFTSEIADRLVPAGSRALLLYLTAERYLESILAGQNSGQTIAALSAVRLARLQRRCPGLALDLAAAPDAILAALGWACEMTSLEQAAGALPVGAAMWLDFDRFLADPVAGFGAAAAHFGLTPTPAEAHAIATGPLMRRYSKAPEYAYSPELRRQILADARRAHGPAIRQGLDWIGELAERYPAVAAAVRRAQGEG